MVTTQESFEAFLDGIFFPPQGKAKKKKKKASDFEGFFRSDATGERILALPAGGVRSLYLGYEYPEVVFVGSGAPAFEAAADRISALFPAPPEVVTDAFDDRNKKLLAFRADSYWFFSLPEGEEIPPEFSGAKGSKNANDSPTLDALSRDAPALSSSVPVILVKKTAIKSLEAALNGEQSSPKSSQAALPSDSWTISHPAEFLASRFFLPPRAAVSSYAFAAVPLTLVRKPVWPQNTRHLCFNAAWAFAGQQLSVRYHVDLSPTAGPQLEAVCKASAAAFFKEALAFWGFWKRPIEKASLTESREAPSSSALFLVAEIRGESQRFRCTVELPAYFVPLILKMTQTALRENQPQAGLLDLVRANDRLFLLMNPGYRKTFLANSTGGPAFRGPTLYGLLSLLDDADKSIVIQNFLLTHYELQNIPFFFYYHVGQKKGDDETVYRLRPAVPLVPGEIERFLSDLVRKEWNYALSRGCMHHISGADDLVALNEAVVLKLAQESVSGKLLLSEKALCLLREEVLAPIDASFQRELDEFNRHTEFFDGVKDVSARGLTEMLSKIDNATLARSCLKWEPLLALLEKGMSQGRRSDVHAELSVVKSRVERGEISARDILEAKSRLSGLVRELAELYGDMVV